MYIFLSTGEFGANQTEQEEIKAQLFFEVYNYAILIVVFSFASIGILTIYEWRKKLLRWEKVDDGVIEFLV